MEGDGSGKEPGGRRARVSIQYCTKCRWMLRAAWMAQELLVTFEDEVGEVVLIPGEGGVFDIRVAGDLVWSRQETGTFPDLKGLKQLVRSKVAPGKSLGHSDR